MRWLVLAMSALASAAAAGPDITTEIFPQLPIVAVSSDNPRCREDSQTLLDNLSNSTLWATKMWDASAKGVVGLLAGNVYQMGNFDECVAQVHPMRAQYCLVTVTLSPNAGADNKHNLTEGSVWDKIKYNGDPSKVRRDLIHWALCVPSSCSHADIEEAINLHLATTGKNNSVHVTVDDGACQTGRQEERLSSGATTFCIVLGLIVSLVFGCTLFDFYSSSGDDNDDNQNNAIGYLLCFSMRKNWTEMGLRVDSDLNFLHGIRFLVMCIMIFGHRVGNFISRPVLNYEYIEQQYTRGYILIIYKGDLLVDVFFVLGGILCTYILCLNLDKRNVNPLMVIVLRFIRLTPVYMLVVFFYATLMYHVNDGPLWHRLMGPERDACVENWWTNLLYISNYVKDDEMCMIHSWYLPCDTHFFAITLFLVLVLHKRPKTGICILTALIFASALVPFLITFIGRKAPLLYFYSGFFAAPKTHEVFQMLYTKSHARASPYFVGVATGYFIYRNRSLKRTYEWTSRAGLVISSLIGIASVLPAYMFYNPNWEFDLLQAALYAGLHRIVWAVGCCGIGLSIIFYKSSIFNAILSWYPWTVLSKLAYCQYLVHFTMQTMHLASMRSPQHGNWLDVFSQSLADICWSLIIALALHLTVEAPIRLVVRRLLQPRTTASASKSEDLEPKQKFGTLPEDFVESPKLSTDFVIPRVSSGNLV